jgi:hypothetical protein
MFDAFQLQVRYHQPTHQATLRVIISGETAQLLAGLGLGRPDEPRREQAQPATPRTPPAATATINTFTDALCAPNMSQYELSSSA